MRPPPYARECLGRLLGLCPVSCLKTDGTLPCWGEDEDGQIPSPSGSVLQVSAGAFHICGLRTDGTLACWGNAALGGPSVREAVFGPRYGSCKAVDHATTCTSIATEIPVAHAGYRPRATIRRPQGRRLFFAGRILGLTGHEVRGVRRCSLTCGSVATEQILPAQPRILSS
jgi:hypothetical protein